MEKQYDDIFKNVLKRTYDEYYTYEKYLSSNSILDNVIKYGDKFIFAPFGIDGNGNLLFEEEIQKINIEDMSISIRIDKLKYEERDKFTTLQKDTLTVSPVADILILK